MACTNKDLYKSVRKCPGTIIRPGIKPKFPPSRFRRFLHGQSFQILAIPPRDWRNSPPIRVTSLLPLMPSGTQLTS